jgi:hypothetical protein
LSAGRDQPLHSLAIFAHLAGQVNRGAWVGPSDSAGGDWVVWVGRGCWPYPQAVAEADGQGAGLDRSLFIDAGEVASRLWAMDLAARNPAVAMVIGDGRGFDMAATRRLQLAARDGRGVVLLGRSMQEQGEVSAAATRWQVLPVRSPTTAPRWQMTLWRCKGVQGKLNTDAERSWQLERSRATGLVPVVAPATDRTAPVPSVIPTEQASASQSVQRSAS